MIVIANYPALKQILWDYRAPEISDEDAFYYYEERLTKWFDEEEITTIEAELLEQLIQKYGAGVPLF